MTKYLVLLALLAGCDTKETYDDVSAEPRSREAIGARYEVVRPLDAYGIRRHSKAPVDYVVLIPPPGIDGTTIGFRIPVRPGSTVTVTKIVRTNRLLDNKMNLGVELQGTPLPVAVPVSIELFRGNEGQGYLKLNSSIYRKIPPN